MSIQDVLRESAQYTQGVQDARVVAKALSPADLRQKLNLLPSDSKDHYMRGFVGELRAIEAVAFPADGIRRGQGGTCHGLLTVRLEGPQGSGKSLVAGILKCILPLLPLEQFQIVQYEQ